MGNEELKIYQVTSRITGERCYSVSYTAEDACKQAGGVTLDCDVIEQKPVRKDTPDQGYRLLIRLPCEVCPYQYAECKKPEGAECPVRSELPELADWLKQATKAHLCSHIGQELVKCDYLLRQKWLTVEDAINELSHKT